MAKSFPIFPLSGIHYFLTNPRLWFKVLIANFLGNLGIFIVSIALLWYYWPEEGAQSLFSIANIVWQWLIGLASTLAVLIPFMKGKSGRVVLHPVLQELGILTTIKGNPRNMMLLVRYTLDTLKWRILWLFLAIFLYFYNHYLGLVMGLWGIGHLVLLDAFDQTLILLDYPITKRKQTLKNHSLELIIAGAVAGASLGLLGLTVFGWLIWTPGCFCGTARWVSCFAQKYNNPSHNSTVNPSL